jgi:hypothetical protein
MARRTPRAHVIITNMGFTCRNFYNIQGYSRVRVKGLRVRLGYVLFSVCPMPRTARQRTKLLKHALRSLEA